MSLARNFYDASAVPKSKTRNLVTTISGIVLLIIQILVSFGLLTTDQGTQLTEITGGVIAAGVQIVGYISAIILMFKAEDAA